MPSRALHITLASMKNAVFRRHRPLRLLALADGRVFAAAAIGAETASVAKSCSNTAMTGYQKSSPIPRMPGDRPRDFRT